MKSGIKYARNGGNVNRNYLEDTISHTRRNSLIPHA